MDEPDQTVVVALEGVCPCGRCRAEIPAEPAPERRQVVELVVRREVTQYRVVAGTCVCGRVHHSDFPEGVTAALQYGPGVSAFALYMTQYQLLAFARTATMLHELAGIAISPGTLYNAVDTAAMRLQAPVAAIREGLVAAPIAHADETGMRVGGGLGWLHVLSNARLTAYFAHAKRGGEGLEAFGLLQRFRGVLVHDHWRAYARFDCLHAFCNAHHLRELIAIAETIPSQKSWAEDMIALRCEANALTTKARAAGDTALPATIVSDTTAATTPSSKPPRRATPLASPRPAPANACARAPPITSSNA